MTSKVYFMDLRAKPKENLFAKLEKLLKEADLSSVLAKNDLTAVKLHFGELGNAAFIRPIFLRKIVEEIKKLKASPFLTDANTVYAGTRSDAVSHLTTAIRNGFAYSVVEAPIVIADGLRGKSENIIEINQKRFKEVFIASEIAQADALISVAHFKGHELSGFGGAIKNVGMGGASRRGKLAQHSSLSPKVNQKLCVACGDCVKHCSQKALSIKTLDNNKDDKKNKKAFIDDSKCIGCGECILICQKAAIEIQWNQAGPVFLEKMVEYTFGALKNKQNKSFFINFITNVSPACDCYGYNDAPIVRDIGILASKDIVAIDKACVDLVNAEEALPNSCLKTNTKQGEDKIKGIYPKINWEIQLDYAESLGMGQKAYELIKI